MNIVMGIMDWLDLVQGRDSWRAFVNIVMGIMDWIDLVQGRDS